MISYMMDEKIDCTVVRELLACYRRLGRVARGPVGGDGAGRVVGYEVRDEEGGLSKAGVIFCQPYVEAPISQQCIQVA